MTALSETIHLVRQRIDEAARQAGRKPEDIMLVAVTKTQPAEVISTALESGITQIGENKVQEASVKLPLLTQPYAGFHFIGHLQSNKVKALLKLKPCLIHSVDSVTLAQKLNAELSRESRVQEILLQVNTSREESKSGLAPERVFETAQLIAAMPQLRIQGLMTIGTLSPHPEAARACFRELKLLYDKLAAAHLPGVQMRYLSMGMTADFTLAIAEGSNLVRIGSAIFGERHDA